MTLREKILRTIYGKLISAGYSISIGNGYNDEYYRINIIEKATDVDFIIDSIYDKKGFSKFAETEYDVVVVWRNGEDAGYIEILEWHPEPNEVIADYTLNLDPCITRIKTTIEKMIERHYSVVENVKKIISENISSKELYDECSDIVDEIANIWAETILANKDVPKCRKPRQPKQIAHPKPATTDNKP
jgi:hypothetical protein